MKKSNAQSVGEIIEEVFKNDNIDNEVAQHRVLTIWPIVVGQTINKFTTARYIRDGILTVHLSSAPLKSELSMHKTQLMKSLNEAVGSNAVKDIFFK